MNLVNVTSFAMPYRWITTAKTDSVVAITLLESDGPNSVTEDTAAELRDCCQELAQNDDLRVVTVAGSGDFFAIGRMRPPHDIQTGPTPQRLAWIDGMSVARALAALPMPVVAILNGDAVAHGLELAISADLRIAVNTARFGAGNPTEDGFPYDGATQRLPRLIGPALAGDMLFTGRTLSAQEALDAGLVNRVVAAEGLCDAVSELVSQIAASAPIAARYAKEAVTSAGDLNLAQGLRLEADLSIILQSTDDRAEGLRAFAERRSPQFTGR